MAKGLDYLLSDAKKLGLNIKPILDPEDEIIIPDDSIEFTEQFRILKGESFSFELREYLYQIYRDDANEIYIVKGRQTEISELLANKMLHNALKYPGTVHIYISDRDSHTSKFSNIRFRDGCLKNSEKLNQLAPWKKHTATTFQLPNDSIVYFHSAWSGFVEAESIPADFIYLDELHNTDIKELDVLKETMSHSKYGRIIGVGKGADAGTQWNLLWNKGNQCEWNAKNKCWIAKNPGAKIHSYHISQEIVPWISAETLEEKRREYTPHRFTTDVIGWWAKGAQKPITDADMKKLFDVNLSFTHPSKIDRSKGPVTIGIDFGGGTKAYTVAWIEQFIDEKIPISRVLYIAKITEPSTEKQADKLINLINAYSPDIGVMDYGGGARQVEKIESMFGSLIHKCSFMSRPGNPWKYDDLISQNTIKIDRTFSLDNIVDLVTRPYIDKSYPKPIPRIQIPAKNLEETEWIIDHFTAMERVMSKTRTGEGIPIYDKLPEDKTDAMMGKNYSNIAFHLWKRRHEFKAVSSFGSMGGGN